jgi:NAD(P)-dependent dehydrogenase (short-subunit alcohol dehydrogenase family)
MGLFLLTAATSPLAVATAHHLARLGHDVVALARDPSRATELPARSEVLEVDLVDPDAIDRLALPDVAGVLHLAGVMRATADPVPRGFPGGPDHVDRTWATNVLGPLRLVHRLLPRLPDGAPVCLISGDVHRLAPLRDASFASTGFRAAAEAATAKVLWTRALARRRPDLVATSFCPGHTATRLHWGLPWPLSWAGAALSLAAKDAARVAPQLAPLLLRGHPSGTYLSSGRVRPAAPHTDDESLQDAVRERVLQWAPTAAAPG